MQSLFFIPTVSAVLSPHTICDNLVVFKIACVYVLPALLLYFQDCYYFNSPELNYRHDQKAWVNIGFVEACKYPDLRNWTPH